MAQAVASNTVMISRMRLTAYLAPSAAFRTVGWLDALQAGLFHSRRQFRHHGQPFRIVHAMPARDLRERAPATEAKVGSRIHHADCDTRRFYAHCLIVKRVGHCGEFDVRFSLAANSL